MSTATPETFVELCQMAVRESGIASGGGALPATVENQTNVLAKMVSRVAESWVEIQGEKKWDFLRATKTFPLAVGVRTYSIEGTNPGDLDWHDLDQLDLKMLFTVTRASDGGIAPLQYRTWAKWRELYALATSWATGTASEFTIDLDGNLVFNAIPDGADVIELPYWKQPQELAQDGDEPTIQKSMRQVIAWRAVRKFAEDKNDQGRQLRAASEESKLYHRMMRVYLPAIEVPPSPVTG
jgi:hypothetical protein